MSETLRIAAVGDRETHTRSGTMAVSSPGGVGRTNRGLAHLVRGERMTIILDGRTDDNTGTAPRPSEQIR